MYQAVTHDIEVTAEPWYRADQSDADSGRHVWSYRITIVNHSPLTVQLVSRYWRIVDETGRIEEVKGPGVVGEQPILNPGDSFQYTSGCPLRTASGTMEGVYTMVDDKGSTLLVNIPAFSLDMPETKRVLN
ncbi:MAG: Co2+/Mg2+ efflux protein ApaG [Rhizobiaceae bacterium]